MSSDRARIHDDDDHHHEQVFYSLQSKEGKIRLHKAATNPVTRIRWRDNLCEKARWCYPKSSSSSPNRNNTSRSLQGRTPDNQTANATTPTPPLQAPPSQYQALQRSLTSTDRSGAAASAPSCICHHYAHVPPLLLR